ncbi:unnamed protein product [Schistosoma margrebowiei]|uniref:Uncharacterized protein n=1 Tax=Schistosoma margrebowiei TaxID=48269 RepID=A0A3P7XS40_9TREM|nr:unnamed protein product [Schistosoma margrebowiei]
MPMVHQLVVIIAPHFHQTLKPLGLYHSVSNRLCILPSTLDLMWSAKLAQRNSVVQMKLGYVNFQVYNEYLVYLD